MRSPEQNKRPRKEAPGESGYHLVVSFTDEPSSNQTYFQLQEAIHNSVHELSVYRFQFLGVWHVALLGDSVPDDFKSYAAALRTVGTETTIPQEILQQLFERRRQVTQQNSWAEGHYRPGIVLPRKKRRR